MLCITALESMHRILSIEMQAQITLWPSLLVGLRSNVLIHAL